MPGNSQAAVGVPPFHRKGGSGEGNDMGVQLLGPLELVVDGRPVDIGSPRQRVVLAMLALNANRVTTVDQLIDAVWDDAPPASARSQIQICVSALRKLMSPE